MPPHERYDHPGMTAEGHWNIIVHDDESSNGNSRLGDTEDDFSSHVSSASMGSLSIVSHLKRAATRAWHERTDKTLCLLLTFAFISGLGCGLAPSMLGRRSISPSSEINDQVNVASLVSSIHSQAQALNQCLEYRPANSSLESNECPACQACPLCHEAPACQKCPTCPEAPACPKVECPQASACPDVSLDFKRISDLISMSRSTFDRYASSIRDKVRGDMMDVKTARMALYDLELALQSSLSGDKGEKMCGHKADSSTEEAMAAFALLSKSARDGFRNMINDDVFKTAFQYGKEKKSKKKKNSNSDDSPMEDAFKAFHMLSNSAKTAFSKWVNDDEECLSRGATTTPLLSSRLRKVMDSFHKVYTRQVEQSENTVMSHLQLAVNRVDETLSQAASQINDMLAKRKRAQPTDNDDDGEEFIFLD